MSAAPTPRRWFRRFVILLVLVAVAGGGIIAWKRLQSSAPAVAAPAETGPRPLELVAEEVTRLSPQDLEERIRLSGALQGAEQTLVRAEVAARIEEVLVREGQSVAAGDVLARLDVRDLKARLDERKANLEAARANLTYLAKQRDQKRILKQQDFVAQTALDQAESAYNAQVATLAALRAQVEVATKAVQDAVIRAPIAGTIAERPVNPGESVAVNAKLFAIVDLSRMELAAMVPAGDVARLRVGQTAAISIEGFADRRFTGVVSRISPTAQSGSRAIPVFLTLDNGDGALRGGMFATAAVTVAATPQALALPPIALRHDDQGDFVLRLVGSTLERVAIRRLAVWQAGDLVQIDGPRPGDIIISGPLPGLKSGQAAKLAGS